MKENIKFQDFLIWLANCSILNLYWKDLDKFCSRNYILHSDIIRRMEVTNPNSLFDFLNFEDTEIVWSIAKEKYINWMKNNIK